MKNFNHYIFQLGLKDLGYYKCRQCGNPHLHRNRTSLFGRVKRFFSGYEVVDCLNCNIKWRVPKFRKKAS